MILYPMVSLGYIWTLLWSYLFFKEPFNRPKILALSSSSLVCSVSILATPRRIDAFPYADRQILSGAAGSGRPCGTDRQSKSRQ